MLDPEQTEEGGAAVMTKRRVEICIGVPDMLTGITVPQFEGLAHADECYFLNFVDLPDADGIGQNGFFAQTGCLCMVKEATICWLQGGTEDEVKAVLDGSAQAHGEEDHE